MTDTTTTASAGKQQPQTTYIVHVYREMRLRFDGIEAESLEQAAEKARELHFDHAAEWSDCEGESLAALVDVSGDEEHEQSRTIDFEPGRMLKAAPKLLEALEALLDPSLSSDNPVELEAVYAKARGAVAEAKGLTA